MGLDFPPTAHPGRELFTAILFVLLVLGPSGLGWLEADFANVSATKSATPSPYWLIRDENHQFLAHFFLSTFRRGWVRSDFGFHENSRGKAVAFRLRPESGAHPS
jgi:hypothetical protein